MSVKVTVVVLTYNHEKFIADALNSIFSQDVNFKIEVLVADDGSKDNTAEIVKTFQNKYPETIVYLRSSNNKGIRSSILEIAPKVNGDFFAILDGDDYWTDSKKLQNQIDFLEANSDFAGCFHDVEIKNTVIQGNQYFEVSKLYSQRYPYKQSLYFEDVVARNAIIPSSSLVLRSDFIESLNLEYLEDNYSTLWKLSLFSLKGRQLKYFNEVWSVYRNHDQGISKGDSQYFHFSHIRFLKRIVKIKEFKYYRYDIYQSIANEYKIILNSKSKVKRNTFQKYLVAELFKIWYYKLKLYEISKHNS